MPAFMIFKCGERQGRQLRTLSGQQNRKEVLTEVTLLTAGLVHLPERAHRRTWLRAGS